MKLKWYGQACFLITADSGLKIITDPYTPETSGYNPVTEDVDIVIRSSDNDSFHCRADLIPGDPVVITALDVAQQGGQRTEGGIMFEAIEAMEALNHRYHDPDQNGMYRFTVDGISIGHMGDIGNALSEKQIEFFQDLDVLLALTGGHPTIELDDLKTLIDRTQPRLVIPMHFRTLTYKPRNIYWIHWFLDYFDEEEDVTFPCDYETTITRDMLVGYECARVLVLDHVR